MLKILTSSLFISLLASSSVFAEEQHNHSQGMGHEGMQAMQLTNGVAKMVDQKNGKITLQHGEIVKVMPAMTMSYRVKQMQQLQSIHAGDKVRFALEKMNNNYVVTHIEVAK